MTVYLDLKYYFYIFWKICEAYPEKSLNFNKEYKVDRKLLIF